MFLFPSGIFTPEKDGLYAQPHEDVMEYYRNALIITSFLHPSPFGRAVAGLAGSIFGAVLFVDDLLDGSHVNNARRVYDFALDITGKDDGYDDGVDSTVSIYDLGLDDFSTSSEFEFDVTYGSYRHSTFERCDRIAPRNTRYAGKQCVLEKGHSGAHQYGGEPHF